RKPPRTARDHRSIKRLHLATERFERGVPRCVLVQPRFQTRDLPVSFLAHRVEGVPQAIALRSALVEPRLQKRDAFVALGDPRLRLSNVELQRRFALPERRDGRIRARERGGVRRFELVRATLPAEAERRQSAELEIVEYIGRTGKGLAKLGMRKRNIEAVETVEVRVLVAERDEVRFPFRNRRLRSERPRALDDDDPGPCGRLGPTLQYPALGAFDVDLEPMHVSIGV